jgi:quercetin dioxygenase-like cupin family protein
MFKKHVLVLSLVASASAFAISAHAQGSLNKFTSVDANDSSLQWGECDPILPKGCMATVIQGDPTKPNANLLVKFPPKYSFEPHAHTAAENMILLQGEMTMEYDGAAKTKVKAGTFAYGPAKAAHRGSCDSDVPCVLYINWDAPVDILPASKSQ